ncbi:alkaline phosphatase PhoX [Haladaptatus sp. T7]|uniref:alkaline phosphatase PhoX n=1 Tax=Haladaptatus sp. T7 TaxID=2029368 RepID=UPI0021A254CE|nr:alkaline phosphatase PhoX [Haladaptatus sp. T7]GKZ14524.1 hypothetical protein HAL_24050 [Haladaptatus sp. T7]
MGRKVTRRGILAVTASTAFLSHAGTGTMSGSSSDRDHEDEEEGTLHRFATSATGAEVTGLYVTEEGQFFFNVQHPSRENDDPYNEGTIGAVVGVNMNDLPRDFPSVQPSESEKQAADVRLARGSYQVLAQGGDETDSGESLGIPTTPDGTPVGDLDGSEYSEYGYWPDFNGFVPDDEASDEGYLFTNFETQPGMITRLHLRQRGKNGGWEVVGAENVDEPLRRVEGTNINCFGSVSPEGVPMSAEEQYSHPATRFWNRPKPATIDDSPGISGDGVQGSFGLNGVEKQALYLGGTRDGEEVEVPENGTATLISDTYANPYRYGHIVAMGNPTADDVTDVEATKLTTFGRAAHEVAVVMPDQRTAYTSSDGTGKCFYKFVADEDVAGRGDVTEYGSKGTLYVAKANQQGKLNGNPAEVGFELDWIPLGHADLDEIESWIAEYDGVTQADYLAIREEVDALDDDASLADIDAYVEENGNPFYITPEEVDAWAEQYEDGGIGCIDEELRRVPFLETRRAAAAVGATDEFRKMEGLNIRTGAVPGEDFLYMAISETSETMNDEEGDIQLAGDEWGAVYRLPLEADYDVSRMEPAVVGGPNANICGGCPYDARPDSKSSVCPDCGYNPTEEDENGTSGGGMKKLGKAASDLVTGDDFEEENVISNPDNLVVMRDKRVIIGEDTSNEGHANDNMIWIYTPESC